MMSFRPLSREKMKPADFVAALGFRQKETDKTKINEVSILPSSCNLNLYAFQLFFEYSRHSELLKILSSDHIEHGFKIIAEAAQTESLNDLRNLIDRIFIFAYIEIFLADKSERADLFVKRQSHFTTFSEEELQQLYNVKCDMADSIPLIFNHIMGPVQEKFGCSFYENIDKFIDESTAPAISFLLKPFLHNEISNKKTDLAQSTQILNRPDNLFGEIEKSPEFFAENPILKTGPNQYPFAQYKYVQNCPIIHISKPKFIPSQIPTITCMNAPRYVEIASMPKDSIEFIFSHDTKLYHCKSSTGTNETCDVKNIMTHINSISAICISECGKWSLSCDIVGEIYVTIIAHPERNCRYQSAKSCVTCCAFSPTVPHMFSVGTLSGVILVYSLSRQTVSRVLAGHSNGVIAVKIHPNSEFLASVSLDATTRIWSVSQGCCVRLFKAAGKLPTSLRFSNNGKFVMSTSADGNVVINDIGSGQFVKAFKPSEAPIVDAVFSRDDQMVVGVDRLGNFFFWETNEKHGAQIASVRIDRVRVAAIECCSNDEIRIIGCSKQVK